MLNNAPLYWLFVFPYETLCSYLLLFPEITSQINYLLISLWVEPRLRQLVLEVALEILDLSHSPLLVISGLVITPGML